MLEFSEKREKSCLFVDLCNQLESSFPAAARAACSSSVFVMVVIQNGTRPATVSERAGTAATAMTTSGATVYLKVAPGSACRRASRLTVPALAAELGIIRPRTKNVLLSSWGGR